MAHGDKRAVHTDALETLGTIISEKEKRDAIHIAVENVIAGEVLAPGQDVAIVNGKGYTHVSSTEYVGIVDPFLKGLVGKGERFWLLIYPRMITSLRHVWSHPAFDDPVEVGVTAQQVKDIVWTHVAAAIAIEKPKPKRKSRAKPTPEPVELAPEPEFNAEEGEYSPEAKEIAETWLRNYANSVDADFDDMIYVIETHYGQDVLKSESWPEYLSEGGKWESESTPHELWDHFVVYKGYPPYPDSEYRPGIFSCSC